MSKALYLGANIVITMRRIPVRIRPIGNSLGVVIPKVVLTHLNLDKNAEAEITVGKGHIVLRKVQKPVREGWAEAAREIAEAGDDALVMGEFSNTGDRDLTW